MFKSFYKIFPESKFMKLQQYPNAFDADRLRKELTVIYAVDKKNLLPHKLLDFIIKSNRKLLIQITLFFIYLIFGLKFTDDLQENIYPQVTRLCELVLTIPTTTASIERSKSTLKGIKTFLRNTMNNFQVYHL